MDHESWPLPLGAAAIGATCLVLSTLEFSAPKESKNQRETSLYQDENGVATIESENRAKKAGKSASTRALIISSVGLATAATDAVRDATGLYGWASTTTGMKFVLWVLICVQIAYTSVAPSLLQRYKASRGAALSSCIATVYCLHLLSGTETWKYEVPKLVLLPLLAATLADVPSLPVVYLGGVEVINRHGSSVLSWLTFSYGFLHSKSAASLPAKLRLQDVPALDIGLRAKTVRDRLGDVGRSTRLWHQLIRFCLKALLLQWSFVLLKSLAEFGSRYALFNILRGMEDTAVHASGRELWGWVGIMFLGLLFGALADTWLHWTTTGILHVSVASALESLVLEKFMRKENRTGASQGPGIKPGQSSEGTLFKDTSSIARAILDNYFFPMAAFKIFFDIFYLSRLLSVRSLVAGALFPIATTLLSKSLAQQHQALQKSQTASQRKTTAVITEMLQNLHHIRLSSLERFWHRRLLSTIADEQRSRWATSMALEKLNFFSSLGPILLASVSISVYALETGHLSPAIAFAALSFFSNLQGVFAQLPANAATLQKSWASVQDLQKYLQQPDQTNSAVETEDILFEEASLTWPGMSNKEEKLLFSLTDVTLRFPRNELSVITGKVGSGKSLLLAALLDEASITSGLFGRPNKGSQRADGIVTGSTAYVSQPPWIDNCSIRDNVVFGYPFDQKRYEMVLRGCALDQDLAALSNGDMTIAGAGGSSLSGGQKWRVALARAFYSPAEALILEDVLGAVDTPIASWICQHALTGEIATGRTVILATHRPEFCLAAARYAITVEGGTAIGKLQKPVPFKKTTSECMPPKPHVTSTGAKEAASTEKRPARPPRPTQQSRSTSQIIMFYLKSAGLQTYLFGVFITVCYQALNASHTWWLTRWTDNASGQHSATIWNVGHYILLSIAGVLALAFQSLVFATVGMAASKSLYQSIVQRVLAATLLWIDSTPFGQLFETIDTDMHIIDNLIAPALNGVLGTILQLGVIVTVSLYSNVYTAVSSVVILVLYAYIGPKMIGPNRRLRALLGPAAHPVSDHKNAMVLGLTTIRAFGRTQLFMNRFYELADNSSKVGIHIQIGNCWSILRSSLLGCLFVTATAGAMVYNNIDAATTGFTITLALQMKATLSKLLSQTSAIRMGLVAADRVIGLTEVPTEPDGGEYIPDWPFEGSLEVDAITMKYGPDLPTVLKRVSFSATSHQRVGIVGRTGAGKSSITNALLRFIEIADGQIRIDGVNTAKATLRQLRSSVKIIPQDPLLFSGTLRSNLDPNGDKTDNELLAVLRRVHLIHDKGGDTSSAADGFGLDMAIDPSGANVSHGQRQLVCLARAILSQCRILVLDEATSGMDSTTDEVIQQVIKEEFGNATVIVVAHKLLTVAQFDKILVMSQGEVCESGAPLELLEKKGMFWDMVKHSGEMSKIEAAIKSAS